MTDDSILLIGIADRKIKLNTITLYDREQDIVTDYGEDSFFTEAWRLLKNRFAVGMVFVLNLDSWDDLKEEKELFRQEDFAYIVPIGLYMTDSYTDVFEDKLYYYSQFLVWMTEHSLSTVIFTGQHATGFDTLTEYLDHEKKELEAVAGSFKALRRNNAVYVANCLYAYPYANVVLAGMLTGDVGEYPAAGELYEACFDIDWCDVPFDLVFFKNNYLVDTSVENLMNFADSESCLKPVTVDRIIKYIARHWPDLDEFIGTGYTEYKATKIYERADSYLQSLVGWILYDYRIDNISHTVNIDSTVSIHLSYTLWPHFTTEKITDEVIL